MNFIVIIYELMLPVQIKAVVKLFSIYKTLAVTAYELRMRKTQVKKSSNQKTFRKLMCCLLVFC